MMPIGVRVDEYRHGDWRVFLTPQMAPLAGQMSATSYASQEEALKAAKEGNYE